MSKKMFLGISLGTVASVILALKLDRLMQAMPENPLASLYYIGE